MKINNVKEFKNEVAHLMREYCRNKGFDWDEYGDVKQDVECFDMDDRMATAKYFPEHVDEIVDSIRDLEKDIYFDGFKNGMFSFSKYTKKRIEDFEDMMKILQEEGWYKNSNEYTKLIIQFIMFVKIFQFKHPYHVTLDMGDPRFCKTDRMVLIEFMECVWRIFGITLIDTVNEVGYFHTEEGGKLFINTFLKKLRLLGLDNVGKIFNDAADIYRITNGQKNVDGKDMFTLGDPDYWDDNPD